MCSDMDSRGGWGTRGRARGAQPGRPFLARTHLVLHRPKQGSAVFRVLAQTSMPSTCVGAGARQEFSGRPLSHRSGVANPGPSRVTGPPLALTLETTGTRRGFRAAVNEAVQIRLRQLPRPTSLDRGGMEKRRARRGASPSRAVADVPRQGPRDSRAGRALRNLSVMARFGGRHDTLTERCRSSSHERRRWSPRSTSRVWQLSAVRTWLQRSASLLCVSEFSVSERGGFEGGSARARDDRPRQRLTGLAAASQVAREGTRRRVRRRLHVVDTLLMVKEGGRSVSRRTRRRTDGGTTPEAGARRLVPASPPLGYNPLRAANTRSLAPCSTV